MPSLLLDSEAYLLSMLLSTWLSNIVWVPKFGWELSAVFKFSKLSDIVYDKSFLSFLVFDSIPLSAYCYSVSIDSRK